MEKVFSDIGVIQNNENEVLDRYLQEKQINLDIPSQEKQRLFTSSGAIAQSIIENAIPEDLIPSINENDSVSNKRKHPEIKKIDSIPVEGLPSFKKMKSLPRLNELIQSTLRRRETSAEWTCPLCENSFDTSSKTWNEAFPQRHLEDCKKRIDQSNPFKSDASTISSDSEVEYKINTDHNFISDDWEDEDYQRRRNEVEMKRTETPFGTTVLESSWARLYEYQREGCKWLYSLYLDGMGGILADEMGLGKTAQVATHLSSLGLLHQSIHKQQAIFLIVCPATVLHHWLQEMHHWAPLVRVGVFHAISNTGKALMSLPPKDIVKVFKTLRRDKTCEGVAIVTTYEGLRKSSEALEQIEWTAVCLDEGQKIRNHSTDITMTCKRLASYHRIILSGTPIQNSLKELWCLFDFVYPGRLGTLQVFDSEFAAPIRAGGYASASKLQYEIAIRCAATLQRIVRPYLLRRKKEDIAMIAKLPPKTEQILFCTLSEQQRQIYQMILSSSEVRNVLTKRIPAFRAITTLRKLCNHPLLVYQNGQIIWQAGETVKKLQKEAIGRDYPLNSFGDEEEEEREEERVMDLLQRSSSKTGVSWAESGKLLVLSKILPIWFREGHKVLIFSQTVAMLYLIEDMLREMSFKYLRLDGSTAVSKRSEIIRSFNDPSSSFFVMLLTTRTGGVGISLTAANRVILFDPDWNPMTDIQARERAWRLGQQREVVIYRLVSKGTIEEKIYQRQIFKLLLSNRILEDPKQKNLFAKSQLEELFSLDEVTVQATEVESLPSEGIIDLQSHKPPAVFPQQTTANESAETGQEKLVLKALFDGEAIATVYNHDYLEPGNNSNTRQQLSHQQLLIESAADKFVNNAMRALTQSAPSYLKEDEETGGAFGRNSSSLNPTLNSSAIIASLTFLRNPPPERESTSSSRINLVSTGQSLAEKLQRRLLRLFEAREDYSSEEILSHFKDLGDQYAPIFKQSLKTVAVLSQGRWKKKTI